MREFVEEHEREYLSPFACLSAETRGRKKAETKCPLRTDFARDRDRIIHSSSFRRLKQKTQVFLAPQGDHYRTRLTHTLEVSQIARTIARALRLNEDLTEAIALGHDLGHTPFGHVGERALQKITPFDFCHAEQSVRVVEKLERDGEGLNLTYEVLNGIVCHQTSSDSAETLEGRVVEYSDKIAYVNHDIEDAVRAGILDPLEIPYDSTYVLGRTKSERITTIIMSIVENSEGKNTIAMSPDVEEAHKKLRKFMFDFVYTAKTVNGEENKAMHIIECLYNYYTDAPNKIPALYHTILQNEGSSRAACDWVASMTDGYAVELYRELYIPKMFLQK